MYTCVNCSSWHTRTGSRKKSACIGWHWHWSVEFVLVLCLLPTQTIHITQLIRIIRFRCRSRLRKYYNKKGNASVHSSSLWNLFSITFSPRIRIEQLFVQIDCLLTVSFKTTVMIAFPMHCVRTATSVLVYGQDHCGDRTRVWVTTDWWDVIESFKLSWLL